MVQRFRERTLTETQIFYRGISALKGLSWYICGGYRTLRGRMYAILSRITPAIVAIPLALVIGMHIALADSACWRPRCVGLELNLIK